MFDEVFPKLEREVAAQDKSKTASDNRNLHRRPYLIARLNAAMKRRNTRGVREAGETSTIEHEHTGRQGAPFSIDSRCTLRPLPDAYAVRIAVQRTFQIIYSFEANRWCHPFVRGSFVIRHRVVHSCHSLVSDTREGMLKIWISYDR